MAAHETEIAQPIDIDQRLDEFLLIHEGPADEPIEAVRQKFLADLGDFRPEKPGQFRVLHHKARSCRYLFHRLEQYARINVKEGADTMQHVGARETLAAQVTVELRAIDAKIAAQG